MPLPARMVIFTPLVAFSFPLYQSACGNTAAAASGVDQDQKF
jgi:hypothetical protein